MTGLVREEGVWAIGSETVATTLNDSEKGSSFVEASDDSENGENLLMENSSAIERGENMFVETSSAIENGETHYTPINSSACYAQVGNPHIEEGPRTSLINKDIRDEVGIRIRGSDDHEKQSLVFDDEEDDKGDNFVTPPRHRRQKGCGSWENQAGCLGGSLELEREVFM